jgi:hypothetical protein
MFRPNLFFIVGLTLYTLSMRLMPYALGHFGVELELPNTFYPWNFSPMTAFCMFGAAYYARKWWAYLLPVVILFIGDLGIWALSGRPEWSFHMNMPTMTLVYASFLLIVVLSIWLRRNNSLPKVWATGLVGEILFFLITNFGVWLFFDTYAKTASGLLECYIVGLSRFGNSLISTFLFSTLIFSPYILKERKALSTARESEPAAT